jgi:UDP-3-O-[3-hydroxymyristoyl] glucosamine N-acyltransferase
MTELIYTSSLNCARFLKLKLVGANIPINRVADFNTECTKAIKFATIFSEQYLEKLNNQPENFVVANKNFLGKLNIPHVITENPRLDFCRLINEYFPLKLQPKFENSVIIADNVIIGDEVYLGHNVVLESGVKIGSHTTILHNVVVSKNCIIGSNCLIKSGTIIGQRGFGFERDISGVPISFPHYGSVIIGNHVEIGALNTIVSGALANTVIHDHVKTDDHVHIAHNVNIGWGSFITACTEISGSVQIGEQAWLGPNCSIIDKVSIGAKSFIGIGCVVTKNVPESLVVVGNPGKILRKLANEN